MRNGIGLSIVAVLLVAAPLAGQERSRAVAPRADDRALRARASYASSSAELATVERMLRLRERLELSDEQISRLESMRRDALARWLESALEAEEMQSRMRAGYEDEDARERLRALAEARRDDAVEMRDRVEALLTDEQREQLDRRSRAVVTPSGVLRRAPEARARTRGPGGQLRRAPEARARMRAPRVLPASDALGVRPLRSPEALRSPRPPRPPRLQSAPRALRPVPAPRPPRPPRVR